MIFCTAFSFRFRLSAKGDSRMDVIPVIDIRNGEVVHAQGGRRDMYRPIQTPLSATSAPADVAAGLLRLAPFRQLYIADLDAIEGREANGAAIKSIARAVPGSNCGSTTASQMRMPRAPGWTAARIALSSAANSATWD